MVETSITLKGSRERKSGLESKVVARLNGKPHPAANLLTLQNIEAVLVERYGTVAIKGRNGRYDLFVHPNFSETAEEIKGYLRDHLQQEPLGGNRNYPDPNSPKGNLFLYYKKGTESFHLGFFNIRLPPLKEE